MATIPKPFQAPLASSTSVFKPDIFKGKVLFCTGGGSGICRAMTESVVRDLSSCLSTFFGCSNEVCFELGGI